MDGVLATIRRILALIRKEFLEILKDPKSRSVLIFPPIMQLVVFGYAANYDLTDVPYVILDQDRGEAARSLLAHVRAAGPFRLVEETGDPERLRELIDSQQAVVALRVADGFSRDVSAALSGQPGSAAKLQVILDGRNSNVAALALTYVASIVRDFNAARAGPPVPGGATGTGAAVAHGGVSVAPGPVLVERAWFNPNLLSRWFFVPGIVVAITQVVTLMVTALSVAREREQGTFDQLLVSPCRPVEILIGKAAPGFLIGMAEATLVILAATLWFQVPLRGNILALYAGLVCFLFCAVGVGLMISSIAVTMQQGLLGGFIYLTPAFILSGFSTPIANMTPVVQAMTYVNPMRYAMTIVRGVFLEDVSWAFLAHQLWPLALIGIVAMTLAGWLFRNRIY